MKFIKDFQQQFRSLQSAHNAILLLLLALACVIFFGQIRYIPVPTIDGALRASMARHMLETGVFWPPFYQHQELIDHPPLYLWLVALAYKIFGVNDFAFHLVQRTSAFGVVCLVALTSRRIFKRSLMYSWVTVFVLLTTRDFILSSVRGYIEPVLEFFIYLSIYILIPIFFESERNKTKLRLLFAGACMFLALFSKGPVALWPMLLGMIVIGRVLSWRSVVWYCVPGVIGILSVYFCLEHYGQMATVGKYFSEQLFASALEGRNHEQSLEPFYFLKILLKSYWPWMLVLLLFLLRTAKQGASLIVQKKIEPEYFFLILSFGFIGAFSAMHWKFWYYIAPAYPALAIVISYELVSRLIDRQNTSVLKSRTEARVVCASYVAAVGLLLTAFVTNTSYWPTGIKFYRDRVPELTILKSALLRLESDTIYFWHPTRDHNQLDTSLYWMFRIKLKKKADCLSLKREVSDQPASVITVWTNSSCALELKAAARTVHVVSEPEESVLLSLQR